jgi:hypothetical protein
MNLTDQFHATCGMGMLANLRARPGLLADDATHNPLRMRHQALLLHPQ